MAKNNAINNACYSLTADTFVSAGSQLIAANGLTITNGGASIIGNVAVNSGIIIGTGGILIQGAVNLGINAASDAINIGTGAAARTITIGNTTGATDLDLRCGTGDFTLASATGTIINAADTGEINYPLQPAFLGTLSADDLNVTGNGAFYTIGTNTAYTEIIDQGGDFTTAGVFTAPVTGVYQFNAHHTLGGCTLANFSYAIINTSNRQYWFQQMRNASPNNFGAQISQLADMDAGDTASFVVQANGESGNTDDLQGVTGAINLTVFSGYLVA